MITDITEEEFETLGNAGVEIRETGKTDIVCPRCGKNIVLEEDEYALILQCEDKNCIGHVIRY